MRCRGVVDAALGEASDVGRQQVGAIEQRYALRRDQTAPSLARLHCEEDRIFVLQLLPLKAAALAVDGEAFGVGAGHLEHEAGDLGGDICPL